MPVIAVRDIRKTFSIRQGMFKPKRPLHAVNGVTLEIEKGDVLGLVGESGCGKTTLAKMILGLEHPTEGEILIDGEPLSSLDRIAVARRVQPIFQDPYSSLNPRKSIGSIISLPLRIHKVGDPNGWKKRVEEMMELTDGLDSLEDWPAIEHAIGISMRFLTGLDGVYALLDQDNTLFLGRKDRKHVNQIECLMDEGNSKKIPHAFWLASSSLPELGRPIVDARRSEWHLSRRQGASPLHSPHGPNPVVTSESCSTSCDGGGKFQALLELSDSEQAAFQGHGKNHFSSVEQCPDLCRHIVDAWR